MPHPLIPLKQVPQLIRAYEQGGSTITLAKQYECDPRTIANTLKRHGVDLRRSGAQGAIESSSKLTREVLALRKQGLSYESISQRVGLSASAVGRFLHTQGMGDPLRVSGSRHGLWKGGRTRTDGGYVLVWVPSDHRFASEMRTKVGYILEHRLVMAEHLGRPLTRQETVHHINDDKADNRIENLQLRRGRHGKHVAYQCADCGSCNVVAVPL